jgi:hypothetical protein
MKYITNIDGLNECLDLLDTSVLYGTSYVNVNKVKELIRIFTEECDDTKCCVKKELIK